MSEKITFKELVDLIAEQSKQSQSSANSFIHELVNIIEGGLKKSGSVSISGFGKFELRWMSERTGINPQTGDELTIPGQNKVVFKPYKALREEVNKPFENLKSRLIRKEAEIEEQDPSSEEILADEEKDYEEFDPFVFEDDDESASMSFGTISGQAFGKAQPSVDELIIERENPLYNGNGNHGDSSKPAKTSPSAITAIPNEEEVAKEVQKSGSYKWSYAAAVIIALIAFILLFLMMQRSGEVTTTPQTADQTEQLLTPITPAIESEEDEAGQDDLTGSGEPPGEASGEADTEEIDQSTAATAQAEFVTDTFSVEPGQSLWTIAQNQLGNPYLWPLIFHLNEDILDDPNQLPAASDLEIPRISNPDNLNAFEREQVALGYFSLYEWNQINNPEEARYFLWAVGVFSPNLLDSPPSQVDSDDLAFARNR